MEPDADLGVRWMLQAAGWAAEFEVMQNHEVDSGPSGLWHQWSRWDPDEYNEHGIAWGTARQIAAELARLNAATRPGELDKESKL